MNPLLKLLLAALEDLAVEELPAVIAKAKELLDKALAPAPLPTGTGPAVPAPPPADTTQPAPALDPKEEPTKP